LEKKNLSQQKPKKRARPESLQTSEKGTTPIRDRGSHWRVLKQKKGFGPRISHRKSKEPGQRISVKRPAFEMKESLKKKKEGKQR